MYLDEGGFNNVDEANLLENLNISIKVSEICTFFYSKKNLKLNIVANKSSFQSRNYIADL